MLKIKYIHIQQRDEKDCGAACLSMIAESFGLKMSLSTLRQLLKTDHMGSNIYGITSAAQKLGMEAEALTGDYSELIEGINDKSISFPFIARIINEYGFEHFIVVYELKNDFFIIGDPGNSSVSRISTKQFEDQWQEQIVTFKQGTDFKAGNKRRNSYIKFFRYITSQKKMLAYVLIISIIMTLINISGALVFQYVTYYTEQSGHLEEISEHLNHEHHENTDDIDNNDSIFMKAVEKISEKIELVLDNLKTVCITVIGLYILRIFIQILRGYLLSKTAKLVDVPLTTDYYNHLLDLPAGYYGQRKSGEYISRFYDTAKIRDAVSTTVLTLMIDSIMAIGCGILLWNISSKLFLITLVILIIYFLIIILFRNPIKKVNHSLMEQEAQVTSYFKETVDGIETIKSYNYENISKKHMYDLYNLYADINVNSSIIYTIQESLVTASAAIGIVFILWIGTDLCTNKIIDLSDLLIFYYLLTFFIDPVKNLINLQPEVQTSIVAAERLNDILDIETENNNISSIDSMKGDISFRNINFRYGNRDLVLKDINIDIPYGSKIAIAGESGCGKTTLIKLLMSFYQPESGTLTLNDTDIFSFSPISIREKIAYVPQNTFMFSDTVSNNLRMGNKEITDDEIKAICKACQADDFISSLPAGYDSILEENGANLSGGQKQRLAIARALLKKPDILILDEATSNLDPITEKCVLDSITCAARDTTCIIIAHKLNTVKVCDKIYVMKDGSIAESGSHSELLNKNGLYASYFKTEQ